MRQYVLIFVLLFLVLGWDSYVFSQEAPTQDQTLIPIIITKVYDGDTITADINFGWDITWNNQSIRLYGFDAWEISRARRSVEVTDEELAKGKQARHALLSLLAGSEGVYIRPSGKSESGNYGRRLASLWVGVLQDNGRYKLVDVAQYMKKNGHDRDQETPQAR